jgi:hypothetical protein
VTVEAANQVKGKEVAMMFVKALKVVKLLLQEPNSKDPIDLLIGFAIGVAMC